MRIPGDSPFHEWMVLNLVEMPWVGSLNYADRKHVLDDLYEMTPACSACELGVVAEYVVLRAFNQSLQDQQVCPVVGLQMLLYVIELDAHARSEPGVLDPQAVTNQPRRGGGRFL